MCKMVNEMVHIHDFFIVMSRHSLHWSGLIYTFCLNDFIHKMFPFIQPKLTIWHSPLWPKQNRNQDS